MRYRPLAQLSSTIFLLLFSPMALDPKSSERARVVRSSTRVGFVVSLFHEELTGAMLRSAKAELEASGVTPENICEFWVAGSFELPLVARRLASRADIDAVICLGLVLKGETTHDLYVAQAATTGILQASLSTETPILFGVLTCDTMEQARSRALPVAEGGREDKGREVVRSALIALQALEDIENPWQPGRRAAGLSAPGLSGDPTTADPTTADPIASDSVPSGRASAS